MSRSFDRDIRKYNIKHNKIILIKIYELFFNETPDFTNDDIYNDIQSMMYILGKFDIHLFQETGFSIKSTGIPYSDNVKKVIDHLILFDRNNISFDAVIISDDTKNKIITISNYINDFIQRYENKGNLLNNISSIFYFINNSLDIKDIINSKYINCNKEQALEIINMLEEMKMDINNSKEKQLLLQRK